MESKKLVSIIIVTRNRKQITIDCLKSVMALNYPRFEAIVVDNGSTDDTVKTIKSLFINELTSLRVKLIEAKKNLGLNEGKNLGQKQARGEYILFLDSDTLVDKKLLSELVKLAKTDPKIAIVCPKMYYIKPKNVIWYAGAEINLLTSQTSNIGVNQLDRGQFDQVRETQFAPTAYLVSRQAAQKLKGHEASLFMTYGDTDYGFRARELGFKVMFCPTAKLWHRLTMKENTKTMRALGYNQPLRAYYFSRNRMVFMKRHAPPLYFATFILLYFPLITWYYSYQIIKFGGGGKFLRPHWQGTIDGLKFIFSNYLTNQWQ